MLKFTPVLLPLDSQRVNRELKKVGPLILNIRKDREETQIRLKRNQERLYFMEQRIASLEKKYVRPVGRRRLELERAREREGFTVSLRRDTHMCHGRA